MCGRGVDNYGVGVFDQSDRLDGCGVGQTEKGCVRAVQSPLAALGIFSLFLAERQQLDIAPLHEPVLYSQPGRAGAAVYKYFHGISRFNAFSANSGFIKIPKYSPILQIYSTICLIIYYLMYKYASVLDELIHFCQSVPYLRTRENSFVKIDKRRARRGHKII